MIDKALEIAVNNLIKPFEGYHVKQSDGTCKAYPDPGTHGKPWTIGWGSTGRGIEPDTIWTEKQAETALYDEVSYVVFQLLKLSPSLNNTTAGRLAALISFCYNCGLGNYRISTLKQCIDKNDWGGAREQIVKWNKAAGRVLPGLTRRRQAEALLL